MAVGKADLHVHTRVSDGMATVEAVVDYAESQPDLDIIAITDHEDASGGLRAREYALSRRLRVRVVPGAEVTTLQGHLLALFIERAPRSFRSIEATIEAARAQGGIVVIPHPMSWLTRSLSQRTIERLVAAGRDGIGFDAIETGNPSPAGRKTGDKARRLNRRWRLAEVGGSDAHHLEHLGAGWTEFDGTTEDDLRAAIEGRTSRGAMSVRYAGPREIGLRRTALGLAWGYAATPRKMLRIGNERHGR